MTSTLQYTPIPEIDTIHRELRAGYESGKLKPLPYRKYQLLQLAYGIKENTDRLHQALQHDLGRPLMENDFLEINATLAEIKDTLDGFQSWAKSEKPAFNIKFAVMRPIIRKEAKGVVLIISPFNYPMFLAIPPLAGAIAAGNCVLLKPSEQTTAVSSLMTEILHKYLDNDLVRVVNGGVPETTKLLDLPWDHILYTGGEKVGRIVAAAAAKHTTPVTLELGGKSPVIIDPSCDLPTAAKRILWGKGINAGQTCVAPDYVLVPASYKDKLLKAFSKAYAEFFAEVSPSSFTHIISEAAYDRLSGIISQTNGTVVLGGLAHADRATKFIPPTVIDGVQGDDVTMRDEIFGPVLPIVTVEDVDEAVRFINARPRPLALYLFLRDESVKKRVLNNTHSGAAILNEVVVHVGVPGLPLGGTGNSGYGCHTGKYTFDTFTHLRSSLDSPSWVDKLLGARYPPYTDAKRKALAKLAPKFPAKPSGPPAIRAQHRARLWWGNWLILAAVAAVLTKNHQKIPFVAGVLGYFGVKA